MYVPLARLQRDLNQPGKVNTHPGRATLPIDLKQHYTLADVGLRVRTLEKPGCLSLESDSALIGDAVAAAAAIARLPHPADSDLPGQRHPRRRT